MKHIRVCNFGAKSAIRKFMDYGEEGGRKGKKHEVTPRPREEWTRMDRFSPVIIEPPIFQAVQEAMDSNPRRGKHWDYVFTNFFVYGTCNSTVSGATQTEGQHRNGTYPYYRCRGTLPDVSSAKMRPKICSMESVRADKLEPVVREHIFGAVKDPTLILEGMQHRVF